MKPAPFDYIALNSIEEITSALNEYGDDAKILAGGQSLVPAMNFRLLQPTMLLDINNVSKLDYVKLNGDKTLKIGALTRQSTIEKDEIIKEKFPLLHETMPQVAHSQIRNRGTIGGNLAHADPASELPAVCIAMGAKLKLISKEGERIIPSSEFFQGMFFTSLEPNEFLAEMQIPIPTEHSGFSFMEFSRRRGDYALMGVAAVVVLDKNNNCTEAKLVYLNAGDGQVDAKKAASVLGGEKSSPDLFIEAGRIASEEEIDPFGNVHASTSYQRHLANILTQRALKIAFERAAKKEQNHD